MIQVITFGILIASSENEYDVRKIPASLRDNADAVIRKQSSTFEIFDERRTVYKMVFAVTIFKKEKQDYGDLSIPYDKFVTISDLEGIIYDAEGEEVKELNDDDIMDYSSISGYSLYEDARTKSAEIYYDKFPYTIEYKYELRYDNYISWPGWYSRSTTDPIEYSSFEVITPHDYDLRFWQNRIEDKPEIKLNGIYKSYLWKAVNLPKLPHDAVDEEIEDIASIVKIAPYSFEIEDSKGSMVSWEEFGIWFFQLTLGKDNLPESSANEIKKLTEGLTSTKSKVDAVYKYMQGKTRYVSVQLGIGGWQPFDAAYVDTKGYGDCKALTNYMVTLLKQAGIKSYPVLIKSGHYRHPMITEFPSNQFNHVIVVVPMETDTMWLECTSQTLPPGDIGWSSENRHALMISPEGGKVIKTPASSSKKNLMSKNLLVNISPKGLAEVKGNIIWEGNQFHYVNPVYREYSPKDKESWIKNLSNVPDVNLNNFEFNPLKENESSIELSLDLSFPKYASGSGNRIFFHPNLMERKISAPKAVQERLSPVRIRFPYLDIDSIIYTLPEGYQVEAFPKEMILKSAFGEFSSKTEQLDSDRILFIRSLEIKENTIPAENYKEYQSFFTDVVKADKSQVVLVKKPAK